MEVWLCEFANEIEREGENEDASFKRKRSKILRHPVFVKEGGECQFEQEIERKRERGRDGVSIKMCATRESQRER